VTEQELISRALSGGRLAARRLYDAPAPRDPVVRRFAVQRLARRGDPEVARALRALIEPR
jgi:hypothetical protein